jgi:hypothetical protein
MTRRIMGQYEVGEGRSNYTYLKTSREPLENLTKGAR